MQYQDVVYGTFLRRPNRFIAHVEIGGREEICHVKNTGRCRELLVPGARLVLEPARTANRKTPFSVVAVYKGARLINMDAQAPNQAARPFLEAGGLGWVPSLVRPEKSYLHSRFDFYLEAGPRRAFVEVKGVTLERGGGAYFPDAPTERGVRHIRELQSAAGAGYDAYILFVVQMADVTHFAPNDDTHPAFGAALREAAASGVTLLAYDCAVTPDSMALRRPVPIVLDGPAF